MKKKKKMMLSIIAGVLTFAIVLGCVLAVVIPSKPKDNTPDDGIAFDELFVRDVLENLSVDDIINDPEWGENLADSTDNFVMVNADKFDYVSHTGMNGGYSMLFFNTETRDIEMIQHSLFPGFPDMGCVFWIFIFPCTAVRITIRLMENPA